jgi:hypothetical protein
MLQSHLESASIQFSSQTGLKKREMFMEESHQYFDGIQLSS